MSLAIEVDNVIGVMLHDGWHHVIEQSFEIDAYEFLHEGVVRLGGGTVEGISATGAHWQEPDGSWVACPLPQILAVRYR